MSCGCKTSVGSGHSCGTKATTGCENVDTCGNSYKLSVFDWLSDVSSPSRRDEEKYVEVRFKNDRKSFFKNTEKIPLHIGSVVVVESSPGHDVGVVSLTGELVRIQMKKKRFREENAPKIYRVANQRDMEIWQDVRKREDSIKTEAKMIASRLGLNMKITDVEYQGDGTKATFYYTAETRIDFRQLIKEYAQCFRTKIDMKQIGFRQEAAKIGGIGSCGRELCCSSWLTDFRSVNTNAARYQQLSINPQKLAGQCGKLKCCLNFELDSYLDALSEFPSSSTILDTEKGKAFCIKVDVFKKKMWFAYVSNSMAWYDIDIKVVKEQVRRQKDGNQALPLEDLVTNNPASLKTVDLIQENSPDRFDKKEKRGKKNNRPQREKQAVNQGDGSQKKDFKRQKNKPSQTAYNQPENEGSTPKSHKPKGKKPFKKNSPKPNNANNNE